MSDSNRKFMVAGPGAVLDVIAGEVHLPDSAPVRLLRVPDWDPRDVHSTAVVSRAGVTVVATHCNKTGVRLFIDCHLANHHASALTCIATVDPVSGRLAPYPPAEQVTIRIMPHEFTGQPAVAQPRACEFGALEDVGARPPGIAVFLDDEHRVSVVYGDTYLTQFTVRIGLRSPDIDHPNGVAFVGTVDGSRTYLMPMFGSIGRDAAVTSGDTAHDIIIRTIHMMVVVVFDPVEHILKYIDPGYDENVPCTHVAFVSYDRQRRCIVTNRGHGIAIISNDWSSIDVRSVNVYGTLWTGAWLLCVPGVRDLLVLSGLSGTDEVVVLMCLATGTVVGEARRPALAVRSRQRLVDAMVDANARTIRVLVAPPVPSSQLGFTAHFAIPR